MASNIATSKQRCRYTLQWRFNNAIIITDCIHPFTIACDKNAVSVQDGRVYRHIKQINKRKT